AVDPTTNQPLTADQRGYQPATMADIGAFQSQGFTLAPAAGSTPQTALLGAAFANPLAVTVSAHDVGQFVNPVDGGVISFAAPAAGASARLSAATAVIANGQASVTATAGATPGSYFVSATAAGAANLALGLTNAKASGFGAPPPRDGVQHFDD